MSTVNRLWESTSKHFAVLCVFARNKKITSTNTVPVFTAHNSRFIALFLINFFFIQKNIIPLRVQKSVEKKAALSNVIYLTSTK